MGSRYEELYKLDNKLYLEHSPVIIEAGALHKDTTDGRVLAQVKIKNVSNKKIVAAKVDIRAFELSGKEIDGVAEFSFLDFSVSNGEDFGSKTAIYLPSNVTRKFNPVVREVVFQDGSVWTSDSLEWNALPECKLLENELGNTELAKQFRIMNGDNCKFYPFKWEGLVFCTCGAIYLDSNEKCYHCNHSYDELLRALDKDVLSAHMKLRLEMEAEKEKELKLKKEESLQRLKKKIRVIVPSTVVFCAIVIILLFFVVLPKISIDKAEQALIAGNTQELEECVSSLSETQKRAFYQSNIDVVVQKICNEIENGKKDAIDYWFDILTEEDLDVSKHSDQLFSEGVKQLGKENNECADRLFAITGIDDKLVERNSEIISDCIRQACESETGQPCDIVEKFSEYYDNVDVQYQFIADSYFEKKKYDKALEVMTRIKDVSYVNDLETQIFQAAVEDAKEKENLDEVSVVFSKIENDKSDSYQKALQLIIAIQKGKIKASDIAIFDTIDIGNELLSEMHYRKLSEAKATLPLLQGAWYGDPYYIYADGTQVWWGDDTGCYGQELVYNTGRNYWEISMSTTSLAKFKDDKWYDRMRDYIRIDKSRLPSTFNEFF